TLRLRKDSAKIEELLVKIKNGGEDEVFSLMLQNSNGGGDIVNTLERMSNSIKKINEYSLANKRVQKLFFDIVFNPFKIYMDSNGKMKIKINYFIGES
ncbi:MAG: hypothetical protein KAJ48_01930, partial [Elusimicrobiales bacterium]|nr:hypothetical protein [Elusimicrobiales bacterium]